MKKDILRHCQPTASTTSFALVTDDGQFLKLDETGNSQVMAMVGGDSSASSSSSSTGTSSSSGSSKKMNMKNMKVTVTGTVEGDRIKVQSLSKV
jgi:hypothetical protein